MFGVGEMRGPSSAGHPVFVISGEEKMSDLSRIAAASLLVATVALVPMATSAEAQRFIPDIIISSTVPGNGDLNPYGVAFVPPGFPSGGTILSGDILISNFNNKRNLQGTGTTIVKLTPNDGVIAPPGQATTFFTSSAIGLTTALGVLNAGSVLVGNLPKFARQALAGIIATDQSQWQAHTNYYRQTRRSMGFDDRRPKQHGDGFRFERA